MKRNLFAIGLIAASFQLNAQFISYVGQGGEVYVTEGALVYNGGGIDVKQGGKVDVNGNVMIVGGNTDQFKTAGAGHFILRLNDPNNYESSKYGQLYITGLTQDNITGIVDKEYRATKNGSMQQMGIPFYKKSLNDLASNLGISGGFSNQRNSNAVGYWDNQSVVMHNLAASANTGDKAYKDGSAILNNNAARYYAVGTKNWDPSAKVHTIIGVPFSDIADGQNISYTLRNAGYNNGTPINFGTNGESRNVYLEKYNTYLQDDFDESTQGYFEGTFGRNFYQFSNPFLTNIDISHIGYTEEAKDSNDDKNAITSIQGIRFEALGVKEGQTVNGHEIKGTSSSSIKYVTFSESYKGGKRVPVGDTDLAVIKPMQAFAIKLANNDADQTLIFNTLRRFAYEPRVENSESSSNVASKKQVAAKKISSYSSSLTNNSVKQLRVIGLDAEGVEVMRTYYAVSKGMVTGVSGDTNSQVITFNEDLSTREENLSYEGKEDDIYRLYINEANEETHKGKAIELLTNVDKIKTYMFQLSENAQSLEQGKSNFTDGQDSFYIEQDNGKLIKISHNSKLSAVSKISKLYYGNPITETLNTTNISSLDSQFKVAYNSAGNNYKVVFPQSWKSASVEVYDMSGKLVYKTSKNSTNEDLYINLAKQMQYIVVGVSENGEKISKKVIGK